METLQFRYSEYWMWPGKRRINRYMNGVLRRVDLGFFLAAAVLILYIAVVVCAAGGDAYEARLDGIYRYALIPALIFAVTLYGKRRGMAEKQSFLLTPQKEQFRTGSLILKEKSVCLILEERTVEICFADITGLECRKLERVWRRGEGFRNFIAFWNGADVPPGSDFFRRRYIEGYQMRIYYGGENELFVTSRELLESGGELYDSLCLAYEALRARCSAF